MHLTGSNDLTNKNTAISKSHDKKINKKKPKEFQ
jgi:hypothetical protein